MASSQVIGILKALLTADTAQFVSAFAKATKTSEDFAKKTKTVGDEVAKLTPQAERMAKAFGGDKLLYSAKSMVAAVSSIGGATKLTTAEQAKVNQKLTEALAKYKALGIEAPAAMRALHKETTTQTSLIGRLTKSLGPMGTALVGAFSVTAIIGAGRRLIDFADTLENLSAQTGISTTALQKFQLAFDPAGVSIETVTKSAAMLSVNLVKGGKAVDSVLKALKLSAADLKSLSLEDQLFKVGDAVGNMQNKSEQLFAARTLFGKGGIEMLQGLNGHLEETASNMKGLIPEKTLKDIDQFGDDMGVIGKQLLGILANAIGPMIPSLGLFGKAFIWAAEIIGKVFGNALKGVTKIILGVWSAFTYLLGGMADLAQKIPFIGQHLGFLAGASDWLHKSAATSAKMLLELDKGATVAGTSTKKLTPAVLGLGDAVEKTSKSTDDWLKQFPSLAAAMSYVRDQIAGLTEAQKAELQAGIDLGLSASDIAKKLGLAGPVVELYTASLKNADKATQDLTKANRELAASLKEHFLEQATKNLTAYVDQLKAIQDASADTTATIQSMQFRRAEHDIEMAKRSGVAWQTVYAMERDLARAKTDAAIADMTREFQARTALLRARIANEPAGGSVVLDQRQLDAETKAYQAAVAAMEEDFSISESEKRDEIERTHDTWRKTYEQMKTVADNTLASISDGFADILVGAKTMKDGLLGIWKSIQSGIASILSAILNDYLKRFIVGLVKGAAGANLGQTLGGSLAGGLAGGLPLGGGGLLGSAGALGASVLGIGGTGAAAGVAGVESSILGGGGAAAGIGLGALTAGIGAAVVGGIALWRHFSRGSRANDSKDKFLSQFAGFDTKRDNNPPGFYGLDTLLSKYKHHDLFVNLVTAKTPGDVKKAEQPIAAFMASLGRNVKMFNLGGFVPPGAVVPAILHGGSFGEDIKPRSSMNSGGGNSVVNVNMSIHAIDAQGVSQFVNSPAFVHSLGRAVQLNGNLRLAHRRAMDLV